MAYTSSQIVQAVPVGALNYTAYTPTWTNLTIGNGTNNFRYAQVGNLVHYYGQLTFGSTTSTSSSATLPLPITGRLSNYYTNNISFYDLSTDTHWVGAGFVSTTTILFKVPQYNSAQNFLYHANVGSTNPFNAAFATGDIWNINFVYEAA
jgi:hypothetical protein